MKGHSFISSVEAFLQFNLEELTSPDLPIEQMFICASHGINHVH